MTNQRWSQSKHNLQIRNKSETNQKQIRNKSETNQKQIILIIIYFLYFVVIFGSTFTKDRTTSYH
jgi:hypothetical protein